MSVIINSNFYHDHAAFSLTCQIELLILWIWFSAYCSCLLSLILSPLCELPVPFCFCRSPMQTYDTICTLNVVSCIFNCLLSHLLTLPSLWPNLSSEIITSSSRLLSFACILFFIIFFSSPHASFHFQRIYWPEMDAGCKVVFLSVGAAHLSQVCFKVLTKLSDLFTRNILPPLPPSFSH